jgi:drug/metabolite transporter superfamily protein YnfA
MRPFLVIGIFIARAVAEILGCYRVIDLGPEA